MRGIGGSKGGCQGHAPPPGVRILSFSCSFRQKIDKIIPIWELAHPLGKILDLPLRGDQVQSECSDQSTTKKDFLKDNHYEIIYAPDRSEYSTRRMFSCINYTNKQGFNVYIEIKCLYSAHITIKYSQKHYPVLQLSPFTRTVSVSVKFLSLCEWRRAFSARRRTISIGTMIKTWRRRRRYV